MYFVKKLVAIRCTRSGLSLDLSLSLSLSPKQRLEKLTLHPPFEVSWKLRLRFGLYSTIFWRVTNTSVLEFFWELQEPWRWRLLHFPCLLQLPMFVPYNPRCSNLNCIVVCYLRESARESSLFFGPRPTPPSFLVIWGPPFELLFHEAFSFSSKEECDLRWRFYGLTMMMMIPGGWWRESSISWLLFSYDSPIFFCFSVTLLQSYKTDFEHFQ